MTPTDRKCTCCAEARRLIYVRGALSCIVCDLMVHWPKVRADLKDLTR